MLSVKERELIVKLHNQRKKQEYIANLMGCSQPTVHAWIQRYKRGSTLETLPRSGRPTVLSKQKLAQLKEEFTQKAKEANKKFCSLDTKHFAEIIRHKTGKEYTPRHVRRILHAVGFSLIMPRSQHLRHDQQKVDAFKDEFKKNSKRSMWIMKSSP